MANTTVLDLPVAVTLDGTEVFPIVQPPNSTAGVSKRATIQQVADFAGLLSNFSGTLTVPNGGTGDTSLDANGVLIGNGTSPISAVAAGTSGYVLTANGTGSPPSFQVAGGLSNQPGLSALGVTGNATASPAAITGTTDQVLRVSPNGTGLLFGQVNLSTSAAVTGTLPVANGGIGTTSLTANAVLVGSGTASVSVVANATSGYILTSTGTGTAPTFQAPGGLSSIAGLSVLGTSGTASAVPAAITGTRDQVLRVGADGSTLAFGQINLGTSAAVTGTLATSFINGVFALSSGGVGTSTLTANSVLLGNGTSPVSAVANATSGYILTSTGTATAPTFQSPGGLSSIAGLSILGTSGTASAVPAAITGTRDQVLRVGADGSTLAFGQINLGTSAAVTGTLATSYISGVIAVPNGGSGTTTITAHAIVVGNGTSSIGVVPVGTDGQLVVGQTGADPAFKTVSGDFTINNVGTATIAANAVTYAKFQTVAALSVVGNSSSATTNAAAITGTANQVLVVNSGGTALSFSQVNLATATGVTGTLPVGNGGSGTTTITANALIVGNGTSSVGVVPVGTNGQVVIGQTGADPAFKTVSGDFTINNVGTATIAANAVTYAKFQTVTGLSVVGNGSTAITNAGAITGTTNQVLVVNPGGTGVAFSQLNLSSTAAWTGTLSLTTGVSGILPIANGGTNASVAATAIINLGGLALATTGQAFSGGVVLTSLQLATAAASTLTLVAGNPPVQWVVVNGTAAIVAPSSDCEIDLLVKNNASASTITFSGYSVGSNTGDTYASTNGQRYIFMSRTINGSSTYKWAALQ